MKKFNFKIILQLMGILLLFNGGFMLISGLVSWYFDDGALEGILLAGGITILTGLLLRFITKGFEKNIKKREGYLVVTLGWTLIEIPHSAMAAELSGDYQDRSRIMFWRQILGFVGGMVFMASPLILIGGTTAFTPALMLTALWPKSPKVLSANRNLIES